MGKGVQAPEKEILDTSMSASNCPTKRLQEGNLDDNRTIDACALIEKKKKQS